MAFCGTASIWAKLAFVAIVIGLILFIVGFATPSWMVYQITTSSIRVGLWRMRSCSNNACTDEAVNSALTNDTFKAAQVFAIFAFIMFLLSAVAVGVYTFVSGARGKCIAITAASFCLTTGLLGFICMIVWLVYVQDPYESSWSMGLVVLGSILAAIAGLLLIPDVLDNSASPRRNRAGPQGGRYY
ncbi:uncharacterized protein LOC128228369 [Mya arenaria]|uniref:uncharacterized protein LOC128228369 n=1 Tax=Mya arenaria TaxID=6604 RepID=UPI0022E96A8E|nr:uncharacterized protein LOC128228369 [Mya arenaria]